MNGVNVSKVEYVLLGFKTLTPLIVIQVPWGAQVVTKRANLTVSLLILENMIIYLVL